jgi:hypothetical protein
VRRVIRNLLPPDGVTPAPDEEVLCRGVWSFTVQYYTGTVWQPTWDSTEEDDTLPAAAQITLQIQRAAAGGELKTVTFPAMIAMSCSTAAQDPNLPPD